jgi:hypothetical protein
VVALGHNEQVTTAFAGFQVRCGVVPAVGQGERDALSRHLLRLFQHWDQLARIGRRIDYPGCGNQHPVSRWSGFSELRMAGRWTL